MTFARQTWAILWKDLLSERRSKETLNSLFFFAVLLLFIFNFALGADRQALHQVLPGLFWLAFVLTGLLGLGRAFLAERENDCLEGLLLAPGDKGAIYLGKLLGNLLLMLVMEVVIILLFAFFYNLDLWRVLPGLMGVAFLGTLGFVAVGTLFGAMTAQLRAREILFPLLLLPVVVPVLLGSVEATKGVLNGQPLGEIANWLKLLTAFDVIFLVVGLLAFQFIIEA